jgi:hypothetical protein
MSTIELKDGREYKDRIGSTVKVRLVEPTSDFPFEGQDEPLRYMRWTIHADQRHVRQRL